MPKQIRLVGGLLIRNGFLLLGRRSPEKKEWANAWDMPGGHVKKHETFEEALLREIDEEIGVVPERFEVIADYSLSKHEPYRIFRVDAWSGGEPVRRNDEHTVLQWFTPAEACALRPLADDRYIELFNSVADALRPAPK